MRHVRINGPAGPCRVRRPNVDYVSFYACGTPGYGYLIQTDDSGADLTRPLECKTRRGGWICTEISAHTLLETSAPTKADARDMFDATLKAIVAAAP